MSESDNKTETVDVEFLKREFEHLRAELAGAKERLSGNAHEAMERINAYLHNAGLTSRVESLEDDLEELAGKLKDTGRDAVTRMEHEVCARPLTSVAVAFGIGLLAARLLGRR